MIRSVCRLARARVLLARVCAASRRASRSPQGPARESLSHPGAHKHRVAEAAVAASTLGSNQSVCQCVSDSCQSRRPVANTGQVASRWSVSSAAAASDSPRPPADRTVTPEVAALSDERARCEAGMSARARSRSAPARNRIPLPLLLCRKRGRRAPRRATASRMDRQRTALSSASLSLQRAVSA